MQSSSRKLVLSGSGILIVAISLAGILMSACGPSAPSAPTTDPSLIQTQSAQTVIAQLTLDAQSAAATPTQPPGPTPDPSIAPAVVPEPQPGQPAATANYNTLLFGGPGTSYVTYGAFLGGKQAVVVGVSEDRLWWAIDVPVAATKIGWVSAAWVTVQGAENVPVLPTPPVPPTTELVPPGPDNPQATAIANTYVRTGPAENYPAYGIAGAGARAWVLGKSADGQWLVVRLNPDLIGAGYGWVALQSVQAVNIDSVQVIASGEPPIVEAPSPPQPGAPSATATDWLNVRSGPGLNYGVLFVAPPGASGVVTGRTADSEWWQVQVPTRYIASGLAWVSRYFALTANVDNVPVVEAPALPNFPVEPPSFSSCALASQTPEDGTAFSPDTLFETSWTVQNTGLNAWDTSNFQIRFLAADHIALHQGTELYAFASSVDVGQSYAVKVPMIAPSQAGTYSEYWEIFKSDNTVVCQFWVTIVVK